MQWFDTVREKDFNLHICTRNWNYIQSIESDCKNNRASLSFAHSYWDAWLDGPKTILALLGASISLLLDMFVAIFSMLFIQNLH